MLDRPILVSGAIEYAEVPITTAPIVVVDGLPSAMMVSRSYKGGPIHVAILRPDGTWKVSNVSMDAIIMPRMR